MTKRASLLVGCGVPVVVTALIIGSPARAAICSKTPDLLLVLDHSISMGTQEWGQIRQAVSSLAQGFQGQLRLGLMLFPKRGGQDCDAGVVDVKVGDNTLGAINSVLNSTTPAGMTPMAGTLQNALSYLKPIDTDRARYVLLMTDGYESCHGNALGAVQALAAAGIKTYVLAFFTGYETELGALAQAGGTAKPTPPYHYVSDTGGLTQALKDIAKQVSCCGNGVVDGDETCDPGISSGNPGACPTLCGDSDPCTQDEITGPECKKSCTHTQVTEARHSDGCCPPGASAATDSDCGTYCGNGALETGETCDPGITSGLGRCPTLADCKTGGRCTRYFLKGSACNVTCAHEAMTADPVTADGCCPPKLTKEEDADCATACGPDDTEDCVDLCRGVVCEDYERCVRGNCEEQPDGGVRPATGGSVSGCSCEATPRAALAGVGLLVLMLAGLLAISRVLPCSSRKR